MGKGYLIRGFSIVDFRCGTHAIGPVPEENLVEIKLEYFVLFELLLNFQGKKGFFYFSCEGLFRGQEKIPGQLLGDGTAANGFFAGSQ